MQVNGSSPRVQQLRSLAEKEDITLGDVRDCGCGLLRDSVSLGDSLNSGLYSPRQFRQEPGALPGQRLSRPAPQPIVPLPPARPRELGGAAPQASPATKPQPQAQPQHPQSPAQPKLNPQPTKLKPQQPAETNAKAQPPAQTNPNPQPPAQTKPKPQGIAMLAQSKAANGQMLSLQEGLKNVTPQARAHLQKLPPEMQKVFVNLSPDELKWMHNRLNGSTQVGFFSVNHREAFISGRALGQDVYQYAINGLKKQIAQGTLPAHLEGRLTNVILQVKALSVEQRTSLMDALDAQAGKR